MTAHSTHLVLVPGLACTEDLFAVRLRADGNLYQGGGIVVGLSYV
jgi:hypothetical protein